METTLIIIIGLIGFLFVIKGFVKNIHQIRNKPQGSHTLSDRLFNYPLMVIWYSYLVIFTIGFIINNLIID